LSLALLSGGGLFLEIALTRLFSTLFYPPFVFAVISIAILGIGLGAALATGRPAWRHPARLVWHLVLAGLATVALLLAAVWIASVDVAWLLLALVVLPYFFLGLALTTFFSTTPAASPRLYRADLLGAGLGALLAIPLLNLLGGLNSVLLAAGLFGLAALVGKDRPGMTSVGQGPGRGTRPLGESETWVPLVLCGLVAVGLVANVRPAWRWLEIDMATLATAKPITGSLAGGGRIIDTTWDSFARTDLVDPGQGRPYELYLDGAAGSVMPPAGEVNLLQTDIGFFPFATAQPETVLVIGPGGGLDVWFGLSGRARRITAVEINPASVAMVNRWAAYHGHLYDQPGVRVLVDEGRSVLRREGERYDLIYLSQVVTLAAERSGYALTENSIYTVQAFADYLAHLTPEGRIAMKLYDELTLTRATLTALAALVEARSLTEAEAMGHLAIYLDPAAEPPVPLLLVHNQPLSRETALAEAGVAAQVGFVPLFVPGVVGGPPLDAVLSGETTLAAIVADSASDVSPTTDDRPFFYQFERGLPQTLRPLLAGLGLIGLAGSVGLVIGQRRFARPLIRYAPLYFAALGAGFIAVEIALIQQIRLFLGHPTLAVTTVLAGLLLGGSLGSHLAGRWPAGTAQKRLFWTTGAITGLVLLWLLLWPWLSQSFLAGSTPVRTAVAAGSLLPLAVLMGMPFPLGLRLVGRAEGGARHVALGWAVNGVMTVAGSAGAVALAMSAGFSSVLLAGAGAYALAAAFLYLTEPM
jgi:hypothetical protein